MQVVTIPAEDGFKLAGSLFEPTTPNGRVVLIASAMGVKRGYYRHYAAFLAEAGYTVLTLDYRGIGDSLAGRLRGFVARTEEWGTLDLSGAIRYLDARYPTAKLLLVSHSIGGQLVGVLPNHARLSAILMIAAQSGYWRLWSEVGPLRLWLTWHVFIPILTRLFGYFPAPLFGMGEPTPAGVALEWARWGRSPRYLRDYIAQDYFEQIRLPIRAYSFADDWFAPRLAVAALCGFFSAARVEHLHISPQKPIEHFGFFRPGCELWADTLAWLDGV